MEAHIDSVRVAGTEEGPMALVLLAPAESDDVLPIFIGFEEAFSIAAGMDAADLGRPMTHDLLLDTVEALGGRVSRVVVSGLQDGTYIADLHLDTPRADEVVDARPSDSLALAARTNAPVEVDSEVFEDGRRPREEFHELADIREVAAV